MAATHPPFPPAGPRRPAPRLVAGSAPGPASIPSELYREAGRRVQIASRAFAATWLVILVVNHLTSRFSNEWFRGTGWYRYGNYINSIGVVLSLVGALLAHYCEDRPDRITRLGLSLLVATSALIAFGNQWGTPVAGPGVSWAAAIVLFYPAIVPVTARQMLVAGALACAWDPLFRFLAESAGLSRSLTATEWIWLIMPNMICAALAQVPAHIVRSLGHAIGEAREVGN